MSGLRLFVSLWDRHHATHHRHRVIKHQLDVQAAQPSSSLGGTVLGAIRVPVFGHEYYIVVGSCQSLPLRFASDLEKCWQRSVPNDSEMECGSPSGSPLGTPLHVRQTLQSDDEVFPRFVRRSTTSPSMTTKPSPDAVPV